MRPVITSVALCSNVLTGVGPSMASGNHSHVKSIMDFPERANTIMSVCNGSANHPLKCIQYNLVSSPKKMISVILLTASAIVEPRNAHPLFV